MQRLVHVPIVDRARRETGDLAQVPWPPPARWARRGGAAGEDVTELELEEVEVLERFGCGCIPTRRLAYVEVGVGLAPATAGRAGSDGL